jgi:hypothetical protein
MNIKTEGKKPYKNLSEDDNLQIEDSQKTKNQFQQQKRAQAKKEIVKDMSDEKVEEIENIVNDIYTIPSKQFVFDNGAIMGNINIRNANFKNCLAWHIENTESFDAFIKSVSNFISCLNFSVTDTDIANLKREYEKYERK